MARLLNCSPPRPPARGSRNAGDPRRAGAARSSRGVIFLFYAMILRTDEGRSWTIILVPFLTAVCRLRTTER